MYLIYSLLFLACLILLIEIYYYRYSTILIFLISFYIVAELFISFNIWQSIFLFSSYWKLFFVGLSVISFGVVLINHNHYESEVLFLVLMVFLGVLIVILSDHLIVLYLGLELQTFSLFILIARYRMSLKSSESALKYFILGALSSGLFLLGVSFLFSFGVSLSVKNLSFLGGFYFTPISFASCLICLSFFFKLALFPLHFWIADIYEGSSWDVIGLIATLPKLSILSIVVQWTEFIHFFLICGLGSIIIGSLGALNQTKLKRLLAYSGVSHMGFIIVGFSLLHQQGINASMAYLFIYIFTLLGLLLLIKHTFFMKHYYLIEVGGFHFVNVTLALTWLVFFLSMAGIPPFAGFISKWYLITVFMDYGYLWSTLIILLFSVIGATYYLRVIKIIYFQKSSSYLSWEAILTPKPKDGFLKSALMGLFLYFNISLILHPSLIFSPISMIVSYYF